MARPISDIYDEIIAEKNSVSNLSGYTPINDSWQNFLNALTSGSRVAIWRMWSYLMAYAIHVHEKVFDTFKAKVQAIAAKAVPATTRWLRDQVLKFQYGYTLQYIDNQYQYSQDDPSAMIVKRAAVVEGAQNVLIKAAKLDNNDLPTPLSTNELTSLEQYCNEIKPAGLKINVTSFDPDFVKVVAEVWYDPLVLASDGSLLTDPNVFPVEHAIKAYMQDLAFNGELFLTELQDAMQQAEGVVDPRLKTVEAKYGNLNYQTIIRTYVANAGYLKIDPNNQLSSTLTYNPSNA
jgi:hypothetical protein